MAGAHPGRAAERPVRLAGPAEAGGRNASWSPTSGSSSSRDRDSVAAEVVFTSHDVPLFDEALELLGPRPRHKDDDAVRTFGHIVVDEAQDLSPMQLRVLDRRSLNGSMTIVGDIAQATGAWAHDDWESVLEHLPDRRPPRRARPEHRLPGARPDHGARLQGAPPGRPRTGATACPSATSVTSPSSPPATNRIWTWRWSTPCVVSSRPSGRATSRSSCRARWPIGGRGAGRCGHRPRPGHPHRAWTVRSPSCPRRWSRGWSWTRSSSWSPQPSSDEEMRGPQALYVALTRSTKRLSIVHTGELPAVLQ